ncbi:MAG: histidine--tRNA ligase [Nitriliruptorales bacterium]|nr:histidine--tRNA ligase [Nitriliruptorales bacterium]
MGLDANPPAGTRDFLPAEAARRDRVFATVRSAFERHGFAPLDTPAFERLDVLTGKYGEEGDQLMFKILRRGIHEDTGEADLALRYDLTVPLARVVARYGSQLPTPFRRYQVAPVWRADRPAKGRFREFVQCDIDTVGSDSLVADATTIVAIADALSSLGLSGFRFQLNSRKTLRGLISAYGIPPALEVDTLTAMDKLDKIGVAGVADELRIRGLEARHADALVTDLSGDVPMADLRHRMSSTNLGREGLAEIDSLVNLVAHADLDVEFTPTLARGLGYYTGPIFEVVHDGLGSSIAAGGRYDGLVEALGGPATPACGGSIGLERVLEILSGDEEPAGLDVLVTRLGGDEPALALAAVAREHGWSAEPYAGTSSKLGTQLKYADRRGARAALIQGDQELAAGTVTVKHLTTGDQAVVAVDDLPSHLRSLLDA